MEKFIKKRAIFKSAITRVDNFVKNYIKNPTYIEEVMARLEPLKKNFESYESTQEEIENLDPNQIDDRLTTEETYYRALAQINKLINDQKLKATENQINSSPNKNSQNSSSDSTCQSQIKLPNVRLPTFSGKPQDYTSFMDLFNAVIGSNEALSPVQKLYYLKSHLTSEPLHLIDSLSLINENYLVALEILQNRYKNPLLQINAHIKSILELPKITKSTANSLRDFCTTLQQSISALRSLEVPIDHWDLIMVYIVSNKLDYVTHREYELEKDKNTLPSMKNLLEFLNNRASALENVASNSNFSNQFKPYRVANVTVQNNAPISKKNTQIIQKNAPVYSQNFTKHPNPDFSCIFCSQKSHKIYKCSQFKLLPVPERFDFVENKKLCINCLGTKHQVSQCQSSNCYVCDKKHSTLLHSDNQSREEAPTSSKAVYTTIAPSKPIAQILLPTIKLKVKSEAGNYITTRAILDSASQVCLITDNLVKRLHVRPQSENTEVVGVANCCTKSSNVVTVNILNLIDKSHEIIKCVIVDKISPKLPQVKVDVTKIKLPNIELADPTFFTPSPVELLLSADIYYKSIREGLISLGENLPILQNTKYGYVVAGKSPPAEQRRNNKSSKKLSMLTQKIEDLNPDICKLDQLLPKFWQLEEVKIIKKLGVDEQASLELFKSSVKKVEGRFELDLPFRHPESPKELGNSFNRAYFRFLSLEKRFSKDPELFAEYKHFIHEYITLGHAAIVKLDFSTMRYDSSDCYFAPHQAVIREQSSTTRLRVVFDCSMKTTSGKSLNDILFSTPPPQRDIFDVLLRFRQYKYVFTTDIKKMFRNILISEHHQKYQRILWRESPQEPLSCLQLKTVTYGTTCAPYLATQTLRYLAETEKGKFPLASTLLLEDCYVDDIATGCNDLDTLIAMKSELIKLLSLGSFELHKFCSNSSIFLSHIAPEQKETGVKDIIDNDTTKTLGILWSTKRDCLKVSVPKHLKEKLTKRSTLTFIASIFDPLGLLGCAITPYKIFMQTLWAQKLDWDTPLPNKLQNDWLKLQNGLKNLITLEFPRHVISNFEPKSIELHGFADSSEKCYGAAVYLRVIYTNNTATSTLLCSKSRVAPLKKITLPRLELNSALLLARLINRVLGIIQINISNIYLWSDSTVTLHWIHGDPARWQPFVAHRVIEINELVSTCIWCHVSSKDNAADVLSRGIEPSVLNSSHIWFTGPKWLTDISQKFEKFQSSSPGNINLPEQKKVVLFTVAQENLIKIEYSRFSSYSKLKRTVAYCLRFLHNCQPKNEKLKDNLTPEEITQAEKTLFRLVQTETFGKEKSQIETKKPITNPKLIPLNIFLHSDGLLRVGGRLENANISFNQKHPIILPSSNYVTTLLVEAEHKKLLHAGPQLVLANLRLNCWTLGGRREIKKILHKCVTCFRFKALGLNQIMSPLPTVRVSPSRPFLNTGLDFAGPIMVRQSRARKVLQTKAYISLFICMVTKAVHIELVSDLSTDNFILGLKRFISRRGIPKSLSSDNGSNFHGANNKLKELFTSLNSKTSKEKISTFLTSNHIEWHFIPPLASHFGGLWESNIKSIKHHLHRTLGNAILTFEETCTVLSQIEAILNSRPLTPMSDDPSDLNYLTPGHFLIGSALTSFVEKDNSNVEINRLKFWEICTKMQQQFWEKWRKDYLNFLQQRYKWRVLQNNIKLNTVVLIKEENLPPLSWVLGRVVHVHVSKDGKVRSVDVKTHKGTYTRPIVKLAPLPFSGNNK